MINSKRVLSKENNSFKRYTPFLISIAPFSKECIPFLHDMQLSDQMSPVKELYLFINNVNNVSQNIFIVIGKIYFFTKDVILKMHK